jgi:hypothetical protein
MKAELYCTCLAAGIIAVTSIVFAVQVDGYCYLEGQSDHSGTRVLFEAASPTAQTDSTFTEESGYYQVELSPGLYDVHFSHESYDPYSLNSQFFSGSTTLPEVTLAATPEYPPGVTLSGGLSGILLDTVYVIETDIWVSSTDTLVIEPGAEFYFLQSGGSAPSFTIFGTIIAVGTENDSIKFQPACHDQRWRGMTFSFAYGDSSRLEYCLIRGSYQSGIWCVGTDPTIRHCTIIENSCIGIGAGITCNNYASPLISYCTITENSAGQTGGGIGCQDGSTPSIEYCDFVGNQAAGSGGGIYIYGDCDVSIRHCTFSENIAWDGDGGGIYVEGSNILIDSSSFVANTAESGGGVAFWDNSQGDITNSTFTANACSMTGGGVFFSSAAGFWMSRCVFEYNEAGSNAGGIGCYDSSPWIVNCTISGNTSGYAGGGILCSQSNATIQNTLIAGNYGLGGIYFNAASSVSVSYCDFYDNEGGSFSGSPPQYLGVIISTNVNGDSCDTYYNIFMDPMFVNPGYGNYHLLAGSPCIDAGDPNSLMDPDSTVADIGAFYFDQLGVSPDPIVTTPTAFRLFPNYPNPFNPVASNVRLMVFNVMGQQVATLAQGWHDSGLHRLTFDGSTLASGIYFCRLQAGDYTGVQKMVLLK